MEQTFLSVVGQTFLSVSEPRVRECTHSRRADRKEAEEEKEGTGMSLRRIGQTHSTGSGQTGMSAPPGCRKAE